MLIELMRFMTPARRSDAADGGVPDDALVTEEGEPEIGRAHV